MFVSGRQMSEGSKCPTFAAGSYAYILAPRLLLLRLAVTSTFPRQRLVLQSTTITNLSTAVQSTYTETGCRHAECRTNALPVSKTTIVDICSPDLTITLAPLTPTLTLYSNQNLKSIAVTGRGADVHDGSIRGWAAVGGHRCPGGKCPDTCFTHVAPKTAI